MNVLENTIIQTPFGEEDSCAKLTIDDVTLPFIFHNISHADETYTLSFYVRSESEGSIMVGGVTINTTSEWTRHVVKFIADSVSVPMYFRTVGTYYIYETQIEIGDHATDYRPAVEDVEEEVDETRTIALQTREMFKWIVESGESSSEFTLTDRMATLIAETISLNGNVKVNGDMIVNGTITADKINLNDLFAQNIEANGTITGLRLTAASGDFSGQVKTDSLYVNGNLIYSNGGDYEITHVDYDSETGEVIDVFAGFFSVHDSSVIGNRDNPQGILRIDAFLAVEILGNLFGVQVLNCKELLSDYVKSTNVYSKIIRANKIYEGNQLLSEKYVLSANDKPIRQTISSVYPSAVGAADYNYLSIPNMSSYKTISFNAWIGDISVYRYVIYPTIDNGSVYKISAYYSAAYNAAMDILIDVTNNRIGVRLKSLTGWTASNCGIGTVITTK